MNSSNPLFEALCGERNHQIAIWEKWLMKRIYGVVYLSRSKMLVRMTLIRKKIIYMK